MLWNIKCQTPHSQQWLAELHTHTCTTGVKRQPTWIRSRGKMCNVKQLTYWVQATLLVLRLCGCPGQKTLSSRQESFHQLVSHLRSDFYSCVTTKSPRCTTTTNTTLFLPGWVYVCCGVFRRLSKFGKRIHGKSCDIRPWNTEERHWRKRQEAKWSIHPINGTHFVIYSH